MAVARETALQSFQYKIINRYLPCNVALKLWQKEETDQFVTCGLVDTIEHYCYECALVQMCWQHFYTWWNSLHGVNMNFTNTGYYLGTLLISEKKQSFGKQFFKSLCLI